MSSSFYEIQELATGEIVLKRSDDDAASEPLVVIRFSQESNAFLGAARFEVAKAMIEAGMEAAGELTEQSLEEVATEFVEFEQPVLH